MITISWSNLFNIYTEPLSFYQIIPDASIENTRKIENIVNGLYSIYKPISERIRFKDKKFHYQTKPLISYLILFTCDKISFHIGIPHTFTSFICQRYSTVFPNVTMLDCNDPLEQFDVNKTMQFNFVQKEEYFKSLLTDFRHSAPLPSLLATSKDIQDNDKILFEIILDPIDPSWKFTAEEMNKRYRKGQVFEKPKSVLEAVFLFFIKIIDSIFVAFDGLFEINKNEESKKLQKVHFSSHTNQKINYDGFNGFIRVLSQSDSTVKQNQFAKSVLVSLQDLTDDNELIISKKFNPKTLERKIPYFYKNIYSIKEIAIMLQLPESYLQKDYPILESIQIREINLPKELFQGGIPIGDVKYKGQVQEVSWNTKDSDVATLPIAIFGSQGSGKSEYEINYAIGALEKGQSVFVLDGIKNCEMSDKILNYLPDNFPDNKIVILDFSNIEYVVPLGWNEVKVQNLKKQSDKFLVSNHMVQQLILFLDSLVDDNAQKLSPRMKRYLNAVGLLIFSLPDTNFMDVLNCLTNYDERHKFIKQSGLSKEHKIVKELVTLDKGKDTNYSDIKGIVDRIDLLLGDYILYNLFSTKINDKINFKYFANNGYAVFCKMPQSKLSDGTIDSIMTFLISKVWLAHLMRSEDTPPYKISNVIIDEIHRYPTARKTLDKIREGRKYGLRYVFSAHKPGDFKDLLSTLKSSGSSYMLFNTSKENLRYFEEELLPFTIYDCMETKKYHSKVICNFNKEYCTFDAKVVSPIDMIRKRIDRDYLVQKCVETYGVKV